MVLEMSSLVVLSYSCWSGTDDELKAPEWKMLNSKDLGLTSSSISKPTRLVLNELRKKGIHIFNRSLVCDNVCVVCS